MAGDEHRDPNKVKLQAWLARKIKADLARIAEEREISVSQALNDILNEKLYGKPPPNQPGPSPDFRPGRPPRGSEKNPTRDSNPAPDGQGSGAGGSAQGNHD